MLTDLPTELLLKIFGRVERDDLMSLQVCRQLEQIVLPLVWSRLVLEQGKFQFKRQFTRLVEYCHRIENGEDRNVLQYVKVLVVSLFPDDIASLNHLTADDQNLMSKLMYNVQHTGLRSHCYNFLVEQVARGIPGEKVTLWIKDVKAEDYHYVPDPTQLRTNLRSLHVQLETTEIVDTSPIKTVPCQVEVFSVVFREGYVNNIDAQLVDAMVRGSSVVKFSLAVQYFTNKHNIMWGSDKIEYFRFNGTVVDPMTVPARTVRLCVRPKALINLPNCTNLCYSIMDEGTTHFHAPVLETFQVRGPAHQLVSLVPKTVAKSVSCQTDGISEAQLRQMVKGLRGIESFAIDGKINSTGEGLVDIVSCLIRYNPHITHIWLSRDVDIDKFRQTQQIVSKE